MYLETKQNLSVVQWTKDLFSAYPFITVVDDFPETFLTVPTLSVEPLDIEAEPFQLGDRTMYKMRFWVINIFAENKAQRDEYSYMLLHALEESCIRVYDYDMGFPPDVTPDTLGCMSVLSVRYEPIKVYAELVENLYYRGRLYFSAEFSNF